MTFVLPLLYLLGITYFGDRCVRHFYRFNSKAHRLATSFLTGLILSSVITYLGSLLFNQFRQPLVMGNLAFLMLFALVVWKFPRRPSCQYLDTPIERPPASSLRDWISLGALLIFACWLMFTTLNYADGKFWIGFKGWTDFGANISLLRSFVLGHNFPSEHPFFAGDLLRYHFLFWFQAANLEFLGLHAVYSINLLSILSFLALLILVMTLSELLFHSRAVGRVAALFCLFSSSLSYFSFLRSQTSITDTFRSIVRRTEFLKTGYPFRGEDWGPLTVSVFGYQRHLISGISVLFVVLIFLVDRYHLSLRKADSKVFPNEGDQGRLRAWVFSGVLFGLLPFWNSPAYVSSLIVVGSLLLFFRHRRYLSILLGTALVLGLPQVFLLRPRSSNQPIFHWGYTMDSPSLFEVLKYLGWSFGVKWVLIGVALILLSNAHRKLFLAFSSLLIVVFCLQLSTDIFNNHKLLNIWTLFASMFAAYGLSRIAKTNKGGLATACVLAIATTFGGIVDLFPLRNDPQLSVPSENDRLTKWLLINTKPSDVFLSQTWLTHPVLFTGRKIFLGNTLFAWSAGYQVSERESIYLRMFEEHDPAALLRLLKQYGISYVAIDSGVRSNTAIKNLNESIYQRYFAKVFDDTDRQYDFLTIYKVPINSTVPASFSGQASLALFRPGYFDVGLGNRVNRFDKQSSEGSSVAFR